MAKKPKCKICDEEIDKEIEQWYKNSVGYYHTACRLARGLSIGEKSEPVEKVEVKKETSPPNDTRTIKCYFCGVPTERKTALRKEGKAFHEECYSDYVDRRELFKYCCSLWGLKAPGPLISRQAKDFRKKGYTYKGMKLSLKYFYEVKNNDRNKYKGSETIGIIPYCYEEAKEYYTKLMLKQQELGEQAKELNTQETKVLKVRQYKKKPELFDFENL